MFHLCNPSFLGLSYKNSNIHTLQFVILHYSYSTFRKKKDAYHCSLITIAQTQKPVKYSRDWCDVVISISVKKPSSNVVNQPQSLDVFLAYTRWCKMSSLGRYNLLSCFSRAEQASNTLVTCTSKDSSESRLCLSCSPLCDHYLTRQVIQLQDIFRHLVFNLSKAGHKAWNIGDTML